MSNLTINDVIEIDRGYFGAGDGKAINRHAWREFSVYGLTRVTYVIDRNLSFADPPFEVQVCFKGASVNGITPTLKGTVPDGVSWKEALPVLKALILKHAKENYL